MNKTVLSAGSVGQWLAQAVQLKIVDLLVWYKQNTLGMCSWLSQAEFAFLVQKLPTNCKLFKNRSFGNVWTEAQLAASKRNHPHQKPKDLIRALVESITEEGELIVDPCAGSFIVLEVSQETRRKFIVCDLTYRETREFMNKTKLTKQILIKFVWLLWVSLIIITWWISLEDLGLLFKILHFYFFSLGLI